MNKKTLAIGGPYQGQLVDWPHNRPVLATPNPDTIGPNYRTHYYRINSIDLFGFRIYIWISETIPYSADTRELGKRLLPELLSYKGAMMFDYSGVNPDEY